MSKSKFSAWTKFFTFLVAVVFLISAGCSGRRPSTSDPDSGIDPGSRGTIITFGAYEYQRFLLEPLMEAFHEQNPDITVQLVDLSQSFDYNEDWNQFTYLRSMAQAADTVMFQGAPSGIDLSRYFRDLRPLYESDLTFQADDFWGGILQACQDTYGNVIGLPMSVNVNGLFYDKAAFDAAGVSYPQPGWTWEDFRKTVAAVADVRGSQTKYGFYDMPHLGGSIITPIVMDHLATHGGEVDAAALLDEIMWYVDLSRSGMLSGLKTDEAMMIDWEERTRLFSDDALRPAMWTDSLTSYIPSGPVEYNPSNPYSGMSIERFDFVPFPVSAGGGSTQTSWSWVECATISAGSTNPRAAWSWINFLSRQWLATDSSQVYEMSRAPARKSVADSSGYWDLVPQKAVPAVRYALEHGSYNVSYMEMLGDIHIALANAIAGKVDFELALADAVAARPATPTPPADNAPIVVATPLAPLPEGVIAIKYYFNQMGPNELTAIKTLIDQFNQRSTEAQIRIMTDYHGSPEEDWITSMANNFDCFTTNPPYWQVYDPSSLLNLNTLLSSEPASFSGDFYPEIMDKFRKDGNLYAIPASTQVQMLAYNADLLTRRGLPLPENNWNFEDFIELASGAASTSESDPSYGYMYSPYDEFLFIGRGVKWADLYSNPPEVYMDSSEMQDYLKWLVKMEQENVLFNQDVAWEKMESIMRSGQLAFWQAMMGEKNMWFYEPGREPEYKISMVPYPQVPGDEPVVRWSNDRGHYISAKAQDPKACWDWIKFMSEQPTLFSGVPARRSMAESPAWEASVGKEDAVAYRAAVAGMKPMEEEISTDIQQVVWPVTNWRGEAIRAALEGQDVQQVLVTNQQKADIYLDCALALDTSKPMEELNEGIVACLKQADPEGNW
jgi:ABC-type glycerol-3-phosphate transport system substrate-binding protein